MYGNKQVERRFTLAMNFLKLFLKAKKQENCVTVITSGAIEAEIALLNEEEKWPLWIWLEEFGLNRLIRKGYDLSEALTFTMWT